MKLNFLAMLLSFPAIAYAADPWEGKELGADSQQATIRCRSSTGDGKVRASEVSLAEGVYRVIRNDRDEVLYLPVADCKVTVVPPRPLAETNRR